VLPGFDLDALEWQPLHPRAFRRAVKPALLIVTAIGLPNLVMFGWTAVPVVLLALAWMTLATWQHVRRMRWAVTGDAVAFRSGWLWHNITIAPVVRIQTVEYTESPFDRRALMARVRADTAGGREPAHGIAIPYLARDTAYALYDHLSAQAALTTLRW
jgi:putative membrane protein